MLLKTDARGIGHFSVSIICLYLFDIWTLFTCSFTSSEDVVGNVRAKGVISHDRNVRTRRSSGDIPDQRGEASTQRD